MMAAPEKARSNTKYMFLKNIDLNVTINRSISTNNTPIAHISMMWIVSYESGCSLKSHCSIAKITTINSANKLK